MPDSGARTGESRKSANPPDTSLVQVKSRSSENLKSAKYAFFKAVPPLKIISPSLGKLEILCSRTVRT